VTVCLTEEFTLQSVVTSRLVVFKTAMPLISCAMCRLPESSAGLLFPRGATDQPHQGMTLVGGSVTAAGAGNIYQEKRDFMSR
jgi:hypothetical protein